MTLATLTDDVLEAPARPAPVASFELAWTDVALHDATIEIKSIADLERTRRFAHRGAAISWSRRKLFHGEVFGDAIEMTRVTTYENVSGEMAEMVEDDPVEITLAGFRPTHVQRQFHGPWKFTVEKPRQKHRDDECW